jgi:hypothetical protein
LVGAAVPVSFATAEAMMLTRMKAAFFIVWLGLSFFSPLMLEVVGRRYLLQESARAAVWQIVAGLAWFVVSSRAIGFGTLLRSPKGIGGLLFCAALVGWYAGLLAIRLVNCLGDSSEPQQASIANLDSTAWRGMTVVTISAPSPGVMFACPNDTWAAGEAAGKRLFVHVGRLGLLWGELR